MLDALYNISPHPPSSLSFLSLPNQVLLVCIFFLYLFLVSLPQLYPSADNTILLDAHSLALVRVLAFWEAFPNFKHTHDSITSISVDPGLKLVRSTCSPHAPYLTLSVGCRSYELPYRRLVPLWCSARHVANSFYSHPTSKSDHHNPR